MKICKIFTDFNKLTKVKLTKYSLKSKTLYSITETTSDGIINGGTFLLFNEKYKNHIKKLKEINE